MAELDPYAGARVIKDGAADPYAGARVVANPLAIDQQQLHALSGSVLEGVPIAGPYLRAGAQRVGAALDAGGGGPSYADALKRREDVFNQAVSDNPVTAAAGNVVGGVAGAAPLMVAAPEAFGMGAGGVLTRSLASTLSGGALGGADAAARSGGDLTKTGEGAAIGAGLGMAAMPTGAVIGKGASAAADRVFGLSSPTGAMSGISKPAARYAADVVGDPARMATLQAEINRLGPQAMLADVSPEWMGVARGAASRPGLRDDIVNPLLQRNATKNARLGSDLDASLGQPVIPSQVEAGIKTARQALGPEYERVMANARAVDTTPLANRLDGLASILRGPEANAVKEVRAMLDVPGAPGVLDPHPRALLGTRQAIDGLLKNEANPQVKRQLTMARNFVDAELTRAAPGIKNVDAYYRELARQREALGLGSTLFDTGKAAPRPQELEATFRASAVPEGNLIGPSASPMRFQQGARAEIDRIVGQNANDPLAMQRAVKSEGDWNRDKLRTVFGQGRADRALNAVDRETQFAQTSGRVTAGSDTAMAQGFGNFLNEVATPGKVPMDVTLAGLGLRGVEAGVKKLLGTNAEAKAERFAEELGRLAVAQGPQRDAYMRSLLDLVNKRTSLDPITNAASRSMRALIISAASNRVAPVGGQ